MLVNQLAALGRAVANCRAHLRRRMRSSMEVERRTRKCHSTARTAEAARVKTRSPPPSAACGGCWGSRFPRLWLWLWQREADLSARTRRGDGGLDIGGAHHIFRLARLTAGTKTFASTRARVDGSQRLAHTRPPKSNRRHLLKPG